MKIAIHTPPPCEKTYDLTGLTADEARAIYHALGDLCSADHDAAYNLRRGTSSDLFDVLYANKAFPR